MKSKVLPASVHEHKNGVTVKVTPFFAAGFIRLKPFGFPVFFFHFFCMRLKQLQRPRPDAGEFCRIRIRKSAFDSGRSERMTVVCFTFIRFR